MFFLFGFVTASGFVAVPGDYKQQLKFQINDGDALIYECRFHDFQDNALYVEKSNGAHNLDIRHTNFYSISSQTGTIYSNNVDYYLHLHAVGFANCTSTETGAMAYCIFSGKYEKEKQHSFEYVTAWDCEGRNSVLQHEGGATPSKDEFKRYITNVNITNCRKSQLNNKGVITFKNIFTEMRCTTIESTESNFITILFEDSKYDTAGANGGDVQLTNIVNNRVTEQNGVLFFKCQEYNIENCVFIAFPNTKTFFYSLTKSDIVIHLCYGNWDLNLDETMYGTEPGYKQIRIFSNYQANSSVQPTTYTFYASVKVNAVLPLARVSSTYAPSPVKSPYQTPLQTPDQTQIETDTTTEEVLDESSTEIEIDPTTEEVPDETSTEAQIDPTSEEVPDETSTEAQIETTESESDNGQNANQGDPNAKDDSNKKLYIIIGASCGIAIVILIIVIIIFVHKRANDKTASTPSMEMNEENEVPPEENDTGAGYTVSLFHTTTVEDSDPFNDDFEEESL